MERYIFKQCFTIKENWDELPVFMQEMVYHVHFEMRQSLIIIKISKDRISDYKVT